MNIYQANISHYNELINLWEASVRATHHFLNEDDIGVYRQLIYNQYFKQVALYCTKQDGVITGFIGISDNMVQMLFIHPLYMGAGAGKRLLQYVINEHSVTRVDVNEQNEQAVGFYKYLGFEQVQRSEVDGAGRPYPILSMELL
jgi:putative acetyltransferase